MREFSCAPFHEITVDLDNPETYKFLPNDVNALRDIMLCEIGYYYCYVNYWRKGWDKKQVKRVEKLIKNFTENEQANYHNVLWYQEQVFIFQDEIENMC